MNFSGIVLSIYEGFLILELLVVARIHLQLPQSGAILISALAYEPYEK